ncbi:MAG: integrase core domain-containing protein [Bacteroidia bacterium]
MTERTAPAPKLALAEKHIVRFRLKKRENYAQSYQFNLQPHTLYIIHYQFSIIHYTAFLTQPTKEMLLPTNWHDRENGDPRENAVAERINGILKHEYLLRYKPKNFKQALFILQKSVLLYNLERPHSSISLLTPEIVHANNMKIKRKWKTILIIKMKRYFRINFYCIFISGLTIINCKLFLGRVKTNSSAFNKHLW